MSSIQSSRRKQAERYATVIEGMQLTHLGPYGYTYNCETPTFDDYDNIPLIRNTGHALVDTLTSKIGAIDPPLPSLLTNKGSWRDRRQASDLELLARAEYASDKGFHATLHDLWIAGLKLCAGATGAVAMQFFNDEGKVGARLHDTLDMFWSTDLRIQGCVTWMPVDDAKELFEGADDLIEACAGEPPPEWEMPTLNGQKLTDFVCIYEGWRGARGKTKGKYVACVKNGAALKVRDYAHEKPPFVWLTCVPHLYGPMGHSLLHHVYESMRRDNLILSRVDRAISKTNESVTYAAKGSFVAGEAALTSTEDNKIVWLADERSVPPTTESQPGFSVEHLQVADRHNADAHDVSGMAQSNTTGQRQEGVDSAIGQRYVAALVNERYAWIQGRYIQAVAVDSAKCIIQILCEIFEDEPKLMRLAPGQDTLREVSGAVALKGIESLKYVVQYAAVSGNKGNPADRMQTAFELKQLNILSDDGYAAMQEGGEDLPGAIAERNVSKEYVDRQICRWQYCSDDEVAKPDFYKPPFQFMPDIGAALRQVVDGFMEASMDELEPERLDFFLMFIADCGALAPTSPAPPAPAAGGATQPPPLPAPSAQPPPTAPAPPALAA